MVRDLTRIGYAIATLFIALLLLGNHLAWAAEGEPKLLFLGTNPAGSAYYAVGSALARVLSERSGLQVRVQPYSGSSTYIPLLNSGELALGLNNTSDALHAYQGLKPFHAAPNLRVISVIFPLKVAMFVPKNSNIQSLSELKGKRVTGRYTAQLAVYYNVGSILASASLSWNDVNILPVANVNQGVQALIEGRVDASVHAVGSAKIEEANASISGGIRFLSVDHSPEGAKRMAAFMPGSYPSLVKAGSATGAITDSWVEAYDVFLTTGKGQSDEVGYRMAKTLWENADGVRKAQRLLLDFARDNMVKSAATIPYDAGAIRFYKEKSLWPHEMEKRQQELEKEAAR
jgi:TRAP transporter TAXI family solute receptor